MPALAQLNDHHHYRFNNASTQMPSSQALPSSNGGSVSSNGFWSKNHGDVTYNHLQKFWSELSPQARQKLLRVDKQTLFEAAHKNMYCSRCNGLLLEGFLQIIMHGKSVQQEGVGEHLLCNRQGALRNQNCGGFGTVNECENTVQDPSVHPWAGLTTTRDGTLTLLDCYVYSRSLKVLQNVFYSARARERERELLYPDACGGGGRGWISQGMTGYGRGHGTRDTCALHTARLSVGTLVDFWSALGEETRQSLLRMKEEDFIERLVYRFDSKRFCRDCRRNVIREFKELKELKRTRKAPRCSSWFCVADTTFQYEVSHDTIQADWHQTITDTCGTYHHFEWAVGTGEGQSDILEFENVGLSGRAQVNGLDLGGLNACYITLRAWKIDGRCNEVSVKAHALKGQQCVHSRLMIGDGFVTIKKGESIRRFFEHAEEAEEEEDDDSMDKDGNELDGECSRPQKHAKSPELAREFLLDTATVIFKEQIEKAFREGTARQNAHSIFVCLALKLLEERVHVACKEIITLEKQMKLLEEVEKEKREEEERKERRRTKEREKKLRRKERLREKEKGREKRGSESDQNPVFSDVSKEESTPSIQECPNVITKGKKDSISEAVEAVPSRPLSPDTQDEQFSNGYVTSDMKKQLGTGLRGELDVNDEICSFAANYSKHSSRKMKQRKIPLFDSTLKWSDRQRVTIISENGGTISKSEPKYQGSCTSLRSINGLNKQLRCCTAKSNIRNGNHKFAEKFHCFNNRMKDRYDFNSCSCNQHNDNRAKVELHSSVTRLVQEAKSVTKLESASDMSKPHYPGNNYNQAESMRENPGRPQNKITLGHNPSGRGFPHTKMVWEPMESHKKHLRSNLDSDVTMRSSTLKVESAHSDKSLLSSVSSGSEEVAGHSVNFCHGEADRFGTGNDYQNGFQDADTSPQYSKEITDEEVESSEATLLLNGPLDSSISNTSNSDNCSLCQSEGDSTSSSLNFQNPESSSVSDSEDASRHLERREVSLCLQSTSSDCHEVGRESKQNIREEALRRITPDNARNNSLENVPKTNGQKDDKAKENGTVDFQPQGMLSPPVNQSIHFPVLQVPTMGYYHQNPVSWSAAPSNGLMPFPHPNHYVFASPLGYGYNGDSHFMQYGAVNRLTSPLLNPGHVPIFQPISQINGMNPKEYAGLLNRGKMKEASDGVNTQKVVPAGEHTMEAPASMEGRQKDNCVKSEKENTGFSLFHFGGPIGLSPGDKLNPLVSEANVRDVSLKFSADHGDSEQHTCNKKDAIEEYNLFAASNGIRFSIF